MDKEFALITGASMGLGKAFAIELSKRKINTILVALPNEGLNELTKELEQKYNVSSKYFEIDLTKKENVIALSKKVNEHYNVHILINNVGAGGSKKFMEADVNYIDMIIQLNVMATAILTHQILPNLSRQSEGFILNVSSMSAFSPMGYKTVYPASKVFVHNFSLGLLRELKDTNIFVSVVNPGPMNTKSDSAQRLNQHGFLAKMSLLTPEKVAETSIRQLFKKNAIVMLNKANGFNYFLMKIIPTFLKLNLITRAIKKEVEIENTIS